MSKNKVAIITGGGTGIGKHSAFALLRAGYNVAIAGRRQDVLEAAVAESDAGDRVLGVLLPMLVIQTRSLIYLTQPLRSLVV